MQFSTLFGELSLKRPVVLNWPPLHVLYNWNGWNVG